MLSFFWTGSSSFALASLIAQANFWLPRMLEVQQPETTSFQPVEAVDTYLDEPFCYIRASDGRVIDLTNLCGQTHTVSLSSYPRPPQVHNTGAIKAFDDSVYGEGN
jgi:hypothetical protein